MVFSGFCVCFDLDKNKKPCSFWEQGFCLKNGADLLSQALGQLPLAQPGLTSLFGMGRGEPRRHRHHKGFKGSLKNKLS